MSDYKVSQEDIDKVIDLYYKQPKILYEHLFASYNQLVEEIIPYCLIQEPNYFYQNVIKDTIYLHGFKCSNIRIKPPTFDNDNEIKFPSNARKNHLNYFATVVVDLVQVLEKVDVVTGEKTINEISDVEKDVAIANIPVMVKSKYCSTQIKKDLHGECRYDPGGYFIVNGQEKIVMSIEKMVDNKTLIFTKKEPTFSNGLVYIAQINSRKNDWSDNLQIITIKNRKYDELTVTTSSLVDIPLFVLFRAFGVESDQDIISKITYDLDDVKMINLLRASMDYSCDDNNIPIRTREEAIEFLITKLRRNRMISQSDEELAKIQKRMMLEKILRQDFLPHLGEDIPKKILYLGHMVNKLLNVWLGRVDADDRDALPNKRVETPGILIGQLFRQNWKKMLNEIGKLFAKKNQSDETPINVLNQIKPAVIEQGIKTALATGIWGMNKTKKGVAQSLQRLSWVQAISYLRRVMAPSLDSSTTKVTSIRLVQNLQTQFLCLTGDSEVLLGNGMDTKLIKDIIDKDCVTSINPQTLKQEPSSTFNKFGKMPDKLLKIKTQSGRIIKATPEHPFLVVNEGKYVWKDAKDLTTNDKLIIRHTEKHILPEKETKVFIDEKDVSEEYREELLQAGFLNKNIDSDKLIIIARLLGALNTTSNFYLDDEIDVSTFINDMTNLGFNIEKSNNQYVYLLKLLSNNQAIVPEWIMNADKLIKREYLSAFQGVHGSKISCQNNVISIEPTNATINNVSQLFDEFNIKTSIKNNTVIFDNSLENIINYAEWIGYRYSNEKRIKSAPLIEQLLTMKENNSRLDVTSNLLDNNLVSVNIKEINEIEPEMVYDFTTLSDNHSFIASSITVHNCPCETPEGQKIGIVKSLSMMASVSHQNVAQEEIVKAVLKNTKMKHPADIDPLQMKSYIKIFINGNWLGVCKLEEGQETLNLLKNNRRSGVIDKYTTICLDYSKKEIKIYSDGGRLIRPILVVTDNKLGITQNVITDTEKELSNKDNAKGWKRLLSKYQNLIDYEDVESSNYIMCADRFYRLEEAETNRHRKVDSTEESKINRYGNYRWLKYTHCDLHSWTQLGIIAGNIPFSNHTHAGRNIIHFSQAKQAISVYLTSYKDRMDISQILYYPQVPIVTTKTMEYNNCLDLPYGENAIVAIASYNGLTN